VGMKAKATPMAQDRLYNILLAEDSAADAGIVRIVPRNQDLNRIHNLAPRPDPRLLDIRLPRCSGEFYAWTPVAVMTSYAAPEAAIPTQKHAALFKFRPPSGREEFIQFGVVVDEIPTGSPPVEAQRGKGDEAA